MSAPALLCYCQSSMGMGHLVRTMALLDALSERFAITLLLGASLPLAIRIPDGVEVVRLPTIHGTVDGGLEGAPGSQPLEAVMRMRRDLAVYTATRLAPEVILIELFPFGRKKFASEVLALLAAARSGGRTPLVLCSVRDILVRGRRDQQAHDDRARALLAEHFDGVLVHADRRFAQLQETFKPRDRLTVPVYHTGFVVGARPAVTAAGPRRNHLVVSVGGGRFGEPLLETVLRAHQGMSGAPRLRLVTGPMLPPAAFRRLAGSCRGLPGVEIVRTVRSLPDELCAAAGSISQAGYNTTMELLQTGTPALLVPFISPTDDEQLRRARRLAELGLVRVLEAPFDDADVRREMRALLTFQPASVGLEMDGAARTVELVERLAASRTAGIGVGP